VTWTRREVLRAGLLLAGGWWLPAPRADAAGTSHFTWTQLRYPGSWDPTPRAAPRFLDQLRRRTSVETARARQVLDLNDPALFELPFLYVAGRGAFPALGAEADGWLRRYLENGGCVFFDDATGIVDSPFFRGVQTTLERLLPGRPLAPLAAQHTLFQSFYLLREVPGRKLVRPFLYGVEVEDLTPVVVCANDLGGAWDGDPLGGYTYPCTPGGERQRELSFRLGVNLVLYALTGNYKKDQVHIPFILKRRQR